MAEANQPTRATRELANALQASESQLMYCNAGCGKRPRERRDDVASRRVTVCHAWYVAVRYVMLLLQCVL